jgi:hypothetical protein
MNERNMDSKRDDDSYGTGHGQQQLWKPLLVVLCVGWVGVEGCGRFTGHYYVPEAVTMQ